MLKAGFDFTASVTFCLSSAFKCSVFLLLSLLCCHECKVLGLHVKSNLGHCCLLFPLGSRSGLKLPWLVFWFFAEHRLTLKVKTSCPLSTKLDYSVGVWISIFIKLCAM
ncbi:hypothetical protein LDENG_00138180, partial [Lucifuga dentata]